MGDQRSEEAIRKDISYQKGRHAHQAAELDRMEHRRFSKASDIARLKKIKLQTRDKIARLEAELSRALLSTKIVKNVQVGSPLPTTATAEASAGNKRVDAFPPTGDVTGLDFGRRSSLPVGAQQFRAAAA